MKAQWYLSNCGGYIGLSKLNINDFHKRLVKMRFESLLEKGGSIK